jgi:hypothetical protein
VKCQSIGDTLDELLSCDDDCGDSEPGGSDEVFHQPGMSCLVFNDEV